MQTLDDYILQVRDRLDEPTARKWSDAQLTRFINEGAVDVSRKAEGLFTRETIPITTGTAEVVGPDDAVRIHRIEYQRDSDNQVFALEYRDWNTMDQIWWTQQNITESSTPSYFTLWGYPPVLDIRVYPIPAQDGDLIVYYFALPNTLATGTDVLNMPQGWENLVVSFAEYTAMRNDADPRWQEAKGLYEADLASMIATVTRFSDQSGQFTPDEQFGGLVPSWLWSEQY